MLMEEQRICRKKDNQGTRVSSVKALEVKQYVCHARQQVHKQNNSNTKIGKQNAAEVAEATKGHTLEILYHIYLKSQPFLFIFKQCDTQRKQIRKYVPSVNNTRLLKVW